MERIKEYFEITFYYYNPNIYPEKEYDLRCDEFKKLGVNIVKAKYNHEDFLNLVKGKENEKEGGLRCQICIADRFDNAFELISCTISVFKLLKIVYAFEKWLES